MQKEMYEEARMDLVALDAEDAIVTSGEGTVIPPPPIQPPIVPPVQRPPVYL